MKTKNNNPLTLESLEPRTLLSGLWHGVDIDGDHVTIKLSGPGQLAAATEDLGIGQEIQTVLVANTAPASKLTVKAHGRGDGYVDVGVIDAEGESLKTIKVDGNLGHLNVDYTRQVNVFSAVTLDGAEGQWLIGSSLDKLRLQGYLDNTIIEVDGNLKKAVVNGDIAYASLLVDGELRQITVKGHVQEDALIFAGADIRRLNIAGFLDASTIEVAGHLWRIDVGLDMLDSLIQVDGDIGLVVVDGNIVESTIDALGGIDIIDTWNWIIDSHIVAGPRGIYRIVAYDISDTVIDTDGLQPEVLLDVDYDDTYTEVIIEDHLWYYPVVYFEDVAIDYYDDYVYYYDDYGYDYYGDTYYYYDDYYGYSDVYADIGFGLTLTVS